jgi:hypothetical protein
METMTKIGPGKVTLVKWDDFYEAMLKEERTGDTWRTLKEADFVFGGFSLHGDFGYVCDVDMI